MRTTPIVFRIQEPPAKVEETRDYSSCRGYGEMVTLLSARDNPSVEPDLCYEFISERLDSCNVREGDFLLWAGGDPMSAFLAGQVLAELGVSGLKWLRWDRRTDANGTRTNHGYYTPVEIP